MKVASRSIVSRYGLTLLTSAIAFALTWQLESVISRMIFVFFIASVVVSSIYGGFGPGVLAIFLGAIITGVFFFEPRFTLDLPVSSFTQILIFMGISMTFVLMGESRRRASRLAWANEQWLSTTLKSIGDAVIATDRGGRVVFMNWVAEDLTGWKLEQAKGKDLTEIFNIINEGTRARVENPVEKVMQSGMIVGLANHTVLVARDGREIPIEDSAAPIREPGGALHGVVLVFRDVVERKKIEDERGRLHAQVESQRKRLDDLVESVPGVVWEAWGEPDAASQRIDFVSGYVETLLGYTTEEWLSTPNFWLTIVHPDDRERAAREAMEIYASGTIGQSRFRWVAKNGAVRWIDAHSMVILDEEGKPVGMRGVSMDVTERKLAEEEVRMAKDAAESANRAKDQFLAVLSHELRTPLTPVLATAQALESDPALPEELRPLIEIVRRNVELEVHLIDDLLDLVRVARGKLQLERRPVDLHNLLMNVVEICRSEIYGKKLQISFELGASEHHTLGDSARLQQIFWNLIKNAVKFTPEGGRVSIRSYNSEPGKIALEVTDTGIGIEAEALPRIFDAFEQGEQTITRRFGGLGLGLAISKALVEMHDGVIIAESSGVDKGAIFTVELATIAQPNGIQSLPPVSDALPSEKRDVKILIVDDHEDTNNVMKVLLERQGYQVVAATSVREGLDLAGRDEFDLLISDIGLPDGSGHELMRALQERRPIRGIALSGFGMEGDIQKSREAGFVVHLTKPVTFQKLYEVVRQLTA